MNSYLITKVEGGYQVVHPDDPSCRYRVTKPNGKMLCNCPDYRNAPKGTCEHIACILDSFRKPATNPTTIQAPAATAKSAGPNEPRSPNGADVAPTTAGSPGTVGAARAANVSERSKRMLNSSAAGSNDTTPSARKPQTASTEAPELEKDRLARLLEHPFRADQIKLKDGVKYVDGASVIQRLNDVLGTPNWSFRILGDPIELEKEVIVRGRLTARIGTRKVVKEDFGAHDFARKRSDNKIVSHGDTLKSATTDCIKRCAHQLGVGLHLYSKDGSYRSFRPTTPKPEPQPAEAKEAI